MRSLVVAIALLCAGAAFARPAPPEGAWVGTLDAAAGAPRIGFTITRRPDGTFAATMSDLTQGGATLRCDEVTWTAPVVRIELTKVNVRYEATLRGEALEGTFTQVTNAFPLVLRPVETLGLPTLRRPQEPSPPYPYRTLEVALRVDDAATQLAGTLAVPRGKGRRPGAVLVSSSGPQDRDGTVLGHKPLLVIADALARAGIVTLRFDERGVGGSQGSAKGRTTDDDARDIEAELKLLAARPEVDPKRVGLIGMSEGALVASMVAAHSEVPRFLVLLGTPGKPNRETMADVAVAELRAAGANEAEIAKQRRYVRTFDDAVIAEQEPARQEARLRAELASEPAAVADLIAHLPAATPWYRRILVLDPQTYLRLVKVPTLALNGDKDVQVDLDGFAQVGRALRANGNDHVETHVLPGVNHMFQRSRTGLASEYFRLEETLAPEVLELIIKFVSRR